MNTEEMTLWPSIRENTVQVITTSLSNMDTSGGNGTVIYANNDHVFILTGGQSIAADYYTTDGKLKVSVQVYFADETEGRLFEGSSTTIYEASILTNFEDAKKEVQILHVNAPFHKIEARFSDSEIVDGLRIMMCANINGLPRFSHVAGNISSRYVPGKMVEQPCKSYDEFVIPCGDQITEAGLFDLSGDLIGIYSHQIIVEDDLGTYATLLCRVIVAAEIYPILLKLCFGGRAEGGGAYKDDAVHEMLDALYQVSYGNKLGADV